MLLCYIGVYNNAIFRNCVSFLTENQPSDLARSSMTSCGINQVPDKTDLIRLCELLPDDIGDRLRVIIGLIATAAPDARARSVAMLSEAAISEDDSLVERLRNIDEIIAYLLKQGPAEDLQKPALSPSNVTPLRRRSLILR